MGKLYCAVMLRGMEPIPYRCSRSIIGPLRSIVKGVWLRETMVGWWMRRTRCWKMQPEELQRDFAPDLESFTIVAHMSIRSLANYRSIAMVDEDDDAQRGWSTTNRPAIWHLRLDWLPKSGREVGWLPQSGRIGWLVRWIAKNATG